MIEFLKHFNLFLMILFSVFYFYQAIYLLIGLLKKEKKQKEAKWHRFAVVISARNEERVIDQLLDSIRIQNYPSELVDIYVVADNCTDATAKVAREHGASVMERYNHMNVGKSWALNDAFSWINRKKGINYYDGYFVFDADNVLDVNYIKEMNQTYSQGFEVVTSYRNSKNYDSNWISAGYGLWFLRESRFLNGTRMKLNQTSMISGTGFLVSSKLIAENGGWVHHFMTEDIQFSVDMILQGKVIGYSSRAMFYDEQPTRFSDSWKQRLRWAKGFYQVFAAYGKRLTLKCMKCSGFQFFDILMTIMPATLLALASIGVNFVGIIHGVMIDNTHLVTLASFEIIGTVVGIYLSLLGFGFVTMISEWKNIYCSNVKKILYLLTFPLFMMTYIPISIVALIQPVEWVPINHTINRSLKDIQGAYAHGN